MTSRIRCRYPAVATVSSSGKVSTLGTGTTTISLNNDNGTVFQITPAGVETVLWSFGSGTDGASPVAALTQGTDGDFYGTTAIGGVNNSNGTIFKITPAGVETVLWSFAGAPDGKNPQAPLILVRRGGLRPCLGVTAARRALRIIRRPRVFRQ